MDVRREDPRDVAARVLKRAEEAGAFDDLLAAAPRPLTTLWWALVRERAEGFVGNCYGTRLQLHVETMDGKRRLHFTIDGRTSSVRRQERRRAG